MQDPTPTETILLISNEIDDQPDEKALQNVCGELQQFSKWRGIKKLLKCYDNRFISVNEVSAKQKFSYWANLIYLDAKPVRKRNIHWKSGLIGLLFSVNAIAALYIFTTQSGARDIEYFFSSSVLLLSVGLILLVYMVLKSQDSLVFMSHHGRIPFAVLMVNNPDKRQFRVFVQQISNAITQLQKNSIYGESQLLAAELNEHRRLMEKGILSKQDYQLAKSNIFSKHSPNARR